MDDRSNNLISLPEQDRITNLSCIYERDTAAKSIKTPPDLLQGLKITDDVQADEEQRLAGCLRNRLLNTVTRATTRPKDGRCKTDFPETGNKRRPLVNTNLEE